MTSNGKNKILTIGETLIRLNFSDYLDDKNNEFTYYIGGDALNVASLLGYNGNHTYYLSFLDKSSIWYRKVVEHLALNRVKSSFLFQNSNRLGTYFYLPKSSYLEKASVEYDRANSAYAKGELESKEVERINTNNFNWIHLSGISVAINPNLNKSLLEIVENAYSKGKNVSFDLNYRTKLWQDYKTFKNTVKPFLENSTLCVGWISKNEMSIIDTEKFDLESFRKEIQYTIKILPNLKTIVAPMKAYNHSKKLMSVRVFAYHNGEYYQTNFVDYEAKYPVGSGDAFTGMLINCLNQGLDFYTSIKLANKAYAYKNLLKGDNSTILKRFLEADEGKLSDKIER